MRPRRTALLALIVALVTAAASQHAAAQDKRPLLFVDSIEMPTLSDPQVSPDGKQILFVMEKPDWKNNRRVGHIYRINVDGSNQVQLTFGERGESSPRWSPDGKTIAFTARRDPDTNNQIYLLEADGGEARRLTNHGAAPSDLTWAPDGKAIWFAANDAKSADEKEKDRLQDDVYTFEETNFKQRHLWTADLTGQTKKITDGDFSVTSYELSNDGKKIAMSRAPSPLLEHSRFAEVWVSDADGTNAKQLTKNEVGEGNPSLSPDNSTVCFHFRHQRQVRHLLQRQAVPDSGGRRHAADVAAERDVRGRECGLVGGWQVALRVCQHGCAQRVAACRRGDRADDAAHER
jgi:Tol biopolymer transport system component